MKTAAETPEVVLHVHTELDLDETRSLILRLQDALKDADCGQAYGPSTAAEPTDPGSYWVRFCGWTVWTLRSYPYYGRDCTPIKEYRRAIPPPRGLPRPEET